MTVQWAVDMRLERGDRGWFGRKLVAYLRYRSDDSDTGKYNGGQKLFFWAAGLGALLLLASGVGLWFPTEVPRWFGAACILVHDAVFILFVVAIVGHVYLGTAAEPGTFRGMTGGAVTRRWARLHHPRWYREVTGDTSDEPVRERPEESLR